MSGPSLGDGSVNSRALGKSIEGRRIRGWGTCQTRVRKKEGRRKGRNSYFVKIPCPNRLALRQKEGIVQEKEKINSKEERGSFGPWDEADESVA